jgi:hypothetical protein
MTITHERNLKMDIDPHKIVIIGYDTTHRDEHPCYTSRTQEPLPTGFVEHIRSVGYLDRGFDRVLIVGKDGEYLCVRGQFRIRAARELKLTTIPVDVLPPL